MSLQLRPATRDDASAIAALYNHYVTATAVTFEEEAVPVPATAARLDDVAAHGLPWLVAELDGALAGYAYAVPWKGRHAYRFSVETSIYVHHELGRRGIGSALYGALLPELSARGLHVAIGGIVLPNPASVALHERCGFRQVARFPEVGFKFGRWLDVGYWHRQL